MIVITKSFRRTYDNDWNGKGEGVILAKQSTFTTRRCMSGTILVLAHKHQALLKTAQRVNRNRIRFTPSMLQISLHLQSILKNSINTK